MARTHLAADRAQGPRGGRCAALAGGDDPAGVRRPLRRQSPLRVAFFYVPNGVHMADWTPEDEGHADRAPRYRSSR